MCWGRVGGWAGGQAPQMLLLSRQSAASINFAPLVKIHRTAVLAHRLCVCIGGGPGHQSVAAEALGSGQGGGGGWHFPVGPASYCPHAHVAVP